MNQDELELHMGDLGVARFQDAWDRDKARRDLTGQKPLKDLMRNHVEQVIERIDRAVTDAKSGKVGRKNALIARLSAMDSATLAYLTCRAVFNGIICEFAYATMQRDLGQTVEDEWRIGELAAHDKSAVNWVRREADRRNLPVHMQRAYYRRMEKHRGAEIADWGPTLRIQVGAALIELFADATRLVKVGHKRTGKKTKAVLEATPQIMMWANHSRDVLSILTPQFLPMIELPKAWTGTDDGGYHTVRVPLVKNVNRRPAIAVALETPQMAPVREAVGHLDATPYRINTPVLEVLREFYKRGDGVPGVKSTDLVELPEKPEDVATNQEARDNYRKQARNAYDHNASAASVALTVKRVINIADRFKDEAAIYFPSQLDFRGRVYPMPADLNPQGQDFARALLLFAEPKGLDERGLYWLKVNLANLWGFDKVSLDERAAWADKWWEEIAKCGNDPLGEQWWTDADKPFQFLAACVDIWESTHNGGFSSVRVSMDGSCNGIQHFAAMLRDPVAAAAVNLTASHLPRDIYQDVADVVNRKLQCLGDPQKSFWSDTFRAIGVDRKICKRAVMVMPYGGTQKSTTSYVEDEMKAKLDGDNPFGEDWPKAIYWLSTLVFDATREVVTSGKLVMGWLQEVARIAARNNIHLSWETPTGFVAQQAYWKVEAKNVQTYLYGKLVRQTRDYTPTGKVDLVTSKNGISPNFVHSLDAAAMMMAINAAAAEGVTHFHCIHDDFGTHAADTDILYRVLREQFVKMYEENDVLAQFHKAACEQVPDFIPEPPDRMSFDIQEVLRSDYFFC